MVFTIEPALRVPEEKIYIRLEDLIVITETGKRVLPEGLPMDIDAIERVMREEGMLQRYPRERERGAAPSAAPAVPSGFVASDDAGLWFLRRSGKIDDACQNNNCPSVRLAAPVNDARR